MSTGAGSYDYHFFISRRGSVADAADEVARTLIEAGYRVTVQDYDSVPGRNFAAFIHDALIQAQHLVLLHTADYDEAEWTRAELFNFLASPDREARARRVCVLRCDAARPRGLLSGVVYGDLVGVTDPAERMRIILSVARGEGLKLRPGPRIFGGAMPLENRLFTGRRELLEQLHLALAAEDGSAALTQVAVHGLGGVGKTSLARAYVQRFGDRFAGVWWIVAADRLGIQTGLAALAHELEPKLPAETPLEDAAHLALARLAAHRGTPFLLVYDNVPDPDALAGLLPPRGARLLLTSRWPDWATLAMPLPVEVLPEDEAVDFLLRRAGGTDAAGARALARLLGWLPLALDHAGAYVKQAIGSGFAAYAARVETLLATRPRGTEYPDSVAATFTLAIEAAARESAAAETLLGLFAWLAPDAIPVALVDAETMPEAERDAGLMALAHLSLVTKQADGALGPTVGVHRLVQAVMRARLAERGRTDAARDAAVAVLARHFPVEAYHETRDWAACAALLPHVEGLVALLGADFASADLGEVLDRAGGFLHGRGSLHAAEPLYRRALDARERVLGPEHPDTLLSVNNLAHYLQDKGDLATAEPLYHRALDARERLLGPEHPDTLLSVHNLAYFLTAKGDLVTAEPLSRRALDARERLLGPEHPDTLLSVNNLAGCLQAKGDPTAEPLYRRALEAHKRLLGPDHRHTLLSINNLAYCLRAKDDPAAEPLYRCALAARERVLGLEHPDTLRSVNNLAACLNAKGDRAAAEPLIRRALEGYERVLGPEHPTTRIFRENLAVLQQQRGD